MADAAVGAEAEDERLPRAWRDDRLESVENAVVGEDVEHSGKHNKKSFLVIGHLLKCLRARFDLQRASAYMSGYRREPGSTPECCGCELVCAESELR